VTRYYLTRMQEGCIHRCWKAVDEDSKNTGNGRDGLLGCIGDREALRPRNPRLFPGKR